MSTQEHRQHAATQRARCAVLTVSDTRTAETDKSGSLIKSLLAEAGHDVTQYDIVPDDAAIIEHELRHWLDSEDVQVILTNGGTGIARRDTTVEVVRELLCKELEGFGELFRVLSYQQVGAAAMLSRAVAGLALSTDGQRETFLFTMPGSPNAVSVAMEELILPELPHLLWERKR